MRQKLCAFAVALALIPVTLHITGSALIATAFLVYPLALSLAGMALTAALSLNLYMTWR